jgi:hypothetical protein
MNISIAVYLALFSFRTGHDRAVSILLNKPGTEHQARQDMCRSECATGHSAIGT